VLEDDLVPVDEHRLRRQAEQRHPPACDDGVEQLIERHGRAAHLERHIEAHGHLEALHRVEKVRLRHVDRHDVGDLGRESQPAQPPACAS
jgi:hypothetical protein